ncbi:unnamed protein product, partial [Phaeothamnion confervicola]
SGLRHRCSRRRHPHRCCVWHWDGQRCCSRLRWQVPVRRCFRRRRCHTCRRVGAAAAAAAAAANACACWNRRTAAATVARGVFRRAGWGWHGCRGVVRARAFAVSL